jgi:pyruvate kinase
MNYEIIATLGPGSAEESVWEGMAAAGASGFRLNTSHLKLEELDGWLERIERWAVVRGVGLPLTLDLQGSKWRVGQFEPFDLVAGQVVELVWGSASEQTPTRSPAGARSGKGREARGVLPVPHEDFFKAAQFSNGEIALNDAKIRLQIEKQDLDAILARVVVGGRISEHKGITYAACDYRVETISEKDQAIVERARGSDGMRFALSYVKDGLEMEKYRARFGADVYLAAKLERGPALADAAAIAGLADELWLCRGDLGAELGLRGMAEAVAAFSEQAGKMGVAVFMAGQVLEHMVEQPAPTRSEVCYLYDTLARGYRGFVLSDEAAIGRYPVESCRAAAMYKEFI